MRKWWTILSAMLICMMVLSACTTPAAQPAVQQPEATQAQPTAAEVQPAATQPQQAQATSEQPAAAPESTGCPAATVADMKGLTSQFPQQFELDEYQKAAGCTLTFADNPLFAGKDLPPVAERLPQEPLVVAPYTEIGKYGGQMRLISLAPESGTAENLSMRHVQLVRYSDDLQTIVPDVAKSWEWNSDQSEITFHLRKGHKWSDGEAFTADDILFWYYDIQMNEELFPTPLDNWKTNGKLMDIEKVDDQTVKLKFYAPKPGALTMFANSYIQPWQPKHFLSQFHIKYTAGANEAAKKEGLDNWTALFRLYYHDWKDSFHRPVPTLEPYVVTEEDTQHRLVSANPYYFKVDTAGNQLPYINEQDETFISDLQLINLKITAGEVDLKSNALSLTDYSLFKENETKGNYRVELPPAGLAGGMGYTFNLTTKDPVLRELFADVRFKQAMSLAIDREDINQTVFLGLAQPQQFTPADPLFVKFVAPEQSSYMTEYNLEKANALLDEIGLKKGSDGFRTRSDGKPLIINMEYTVLGGPALTHQLVKQYWEAAGVQVNLKEVSTEAFRTRNLSNDQDIFVWRTDGTAAPSLIANSLNAFVPFQPAGLQVKVGIPWGKYWASDGTEGEKPPEWAEKIREDATTIGGLAPYSDEWNAAGASLVQQWNDQLITIGTVGNVPVPLIVSNRMGNTPPAFTSQIWDFYCLFPFRVDQEYIKQ